MVERPEPSSFARIAAELPMHEPCDHVLADAELCDRVVDKEDRSVAPGLFRRRDGIKSLLEPSIAQREGLMAR